MRVSRASPSPPRRWLGAEEVLRGQWRARCWEDWQGRRVCQRIARPPAADGSGSVSGLTVGGGGGGLRRPDPEITCHTAEQWPVFCAWAAGAAARPFLVGDGGGWTPCSTERLSSSQRWEDLSSYVFGVVGSLFFCFAIIATGRLDCGEFLHWGLQIMTCVVLLELPGIIGILWRAVNDLWYARTPNCQTCGCEPSGAALLSSAVQCSVLLSCLLKVQHGYCGKRTNIFRLLVQCCSAMPDIFTSRAIVCVGTLSGWLGSYRTVLSECPHVEQSLCSITRENS